MLCELLREIELPSASKVVPRNLRTSSDKDFSHGIRELINWCGCLDSCRFQGYRVVFNLVGSFKALQGFMTAIGMFYADEMVYIFEGEGSHLFSIPKLPVKVDAECLKKHATLVSMLDSRPGYTCRPEDLPGVPKTLVETYHRFGQEQEVNRDPIAS